MTPKTAKTKTTSGLEKELDNGKKPTAPKKTAKTETLDQFKRRLKSMSKEEMLETFESLLEDETF